MYGVVPLLPNKRTTPTKNLKVAENKQTTLDAKAISQRVDKNPNLIFLIPNCSIYMCCMGGKSHAKVRSKKVLNYKRNQLVLIAFLRLANGLPVILKLMSYQIHIFDY